VQVLSGKFLGDFQRHYDEKGYKIFDWVLETNTLASIALDTGFGRALGGRLAYARSRTTSRRLMFAGFDTPPRHTSTG
jgi:hypothetical protein